MKIELHILQNFPPSNLNRDDAGAPKDCYFGGYRRQRISSQCLKRSVRQDENFRHQLEGRLGIRTKKSPSLIIEKLVELGNSREDAELVVRFTVDKLYGISEEGKTAYLIFIGKDEIERLATSINKHMQEAVDHARTLIENPDSKDGKKFFVDLIKKYKKEYSKSVDAIDVALFGRMLAGSPVENIDAACQVAHAISVNRMSMEFDYYTAIDDISEEDSAGAGMIGTVGFASSCFYRYAVIDIDKLAENLGGNFQSAHEGALAFVKAFIDARPSGKQNTFAAHTPPSFVMAVARDHGQAVSLVNAFESPVKPDGEFSLSQQALKKFCSHYSKLNKMYSFEGKSSFVTHDDIEDIQLLKTDKVEQIDNVNTLIKKVEGYLSSKAELA